MRLNKFVFIVFLGCSILSAPAFSESQEILDDFWLLENYQPPLNSLWLYGGIDDDSGDYYGLSTNLAINSSLYFDFSATRQNYTYKTDDVSLGMSGKLGEQFNWAVSRMFWGKKDSLEKNDSRFSVMYFYNNFNSNLSFETGKIELFLDQPNILQINSLLSDHRAVELSLGYGWGYDWGQLYSEIKYKQHDYQTRWPGAISRSAIFIFASSIGLQQARSLADNESSLLIGFQQQTISYEILFSQLDSAFSNNTFTYASLSLSKSLNPQWQLGVNAEIPLDEGLYTLGMSLGYMW